MRELNLIINAKAYFVNRKGDMSMRILSIGNSFSVDAQYWLNELANAGEDDMELWNLFIGGCSLETHMKNAASGEIAYDLYIDNRLVSKSSIEAALKCGPWDYITLQQASGFSGLWESYENTLAPMYNYVKSLTPEGEIVIHETWAYEKTSTHPHFEWYGNDQKKMHSMLKACYERAAKEIGARIIPVGNAVAYLRENAAFDVDKGGVSLSRDGFHLSFVMGRYLAAAVWYGFFTGKDVRLNSFVPARMKLQGIKSGKAVFARMEEDIPGDVQMNLIKEAAYAVLRN